MSVFLPCSVPPNSIPSWVQRALVMQTCSCSNDSGAQRLTQTQKRLQIMLQFIIHRNRLVYATRCQYQLDQQPEEKKRSFVVAGIVWPSQFQTKWKSPQHLSERSDANIAGGGASVVGGVGGGWKNLLRFSVENPANGDWWWWRFE